MSTTVMDHFVELRRVLARAAAEAFAKHDLGTAQVSAMRELGRVGHASQASLARTLAQDPAALGRTLDALEARGWVRRAASATDRRVREVGLTDEGRRAVGRIETAYAAFTARVEAALTADERARFAALAGKLVAALAPGDAAEEAER